MAKKIAVVVSQGSSANPAKRKLEEDLVAGLLFEKGVEVTVIPNLYDLAPDGTGMLCLQSIPGDLVLLSWLFPRAAHWILDRNGVRGRVGATLLVDETADDADDQDEDEADEDQPAAPGAADAGSPQPAGPEPNRSIYCLDLRVRDQAQPYIEEIRRIVAEAAVQTVGVDLMGWINGSPKPEQLARYLDPSSAAPTAAPVPPGPALNGGAPADNQAVVPAPVVHRIDEEPSRRWYPVIDYSRCTNCLECLDFCLFGVYGVGQAEAILVEQPDNCRKGCPACSRVCPENAIIFPQHKTPAIAGSADGTAGGLKIDLSKLFGAPDALEVAVLERDVELVAVGRDAVGDAIGVPKRQQADHGPKDDLDNLMDALDELDL